MAAQQPLGEFDLIARFFDRPVMNGPGLALGIGDDCALIEGGSGFQWAVTTDMLVEGVHFLPDVDPESLGHKVLAVNMSDLAACGAAPRCYFLALALPRSDEVWLTAFARGLHALADRHCCVLAGGDTTRSNAGVTVSITALGEVPRGSALLRSGARPGDDIWVSGVLGDAALGLAWLQRRLPRDAPVPTEAVRRLQWPVPRVELGERLRGLATSAIDVSDGLTGDLGHILARSSVGARIEWLAIPRSPEMQRLDEEWQKDFALAGGDDYELLFTAPTAAAADVAAAARAAGLSITRIGTIVADAGLAVIGADGGAVDTAARAFDHFRR
jgi:thiamine-monophosphate kinase